MAWPELKNHDSQDLKLGTFHWQNFCLREAESSYQQKLVAQQLIY